MTEDLEAKASRLLADHAVQVRWATDRTVVAAVRGDSGVHDVRWSSLDGWSCSCPCVGRRCSHIEATRSVTMRSVTAGAS